MNLHENPYGGSWAFAGRLADGRTDSEMDMTTLIAAVAAFRIFLNAPKI